MKSKNLVFNISEYLKAQSSIGPLVYFRIFFGLVMFASILRFWSKGWIAEIYLNPQYFFTYFGFDWIKPLDSFGMYALYSLMLFSSLAIAFGFLYRVNAVLFFLAFTYVELIDKTNYLNHYYFISLISFLMILLPAHKDFSADVKLKLTKPLSQIPRFYVDFIRLQLAIVYVFAGLAKLNYDWLIQAMPLKMWLPVKDHIPVIGSFLRFEFTAYAFSWGGAIYDLCIPFIMLSKKLRPYGFVAIVVFHVLTRVLFPIGMFPFIMIGASLIFFSDEFHFRLLKKAKSLFRFPNLKSALPDQTGRKWVIGILSLIFFIQLLLPWRYLLYPGNLFWTEEGYRFSWRVMLMEKAGYAIFHVNDANSKKSVEVEPSDFLTPNQVKMMSTQPDMILQFAHYLENIYRNKGMKHPEIRVESYVSLNGEPSRLFIDSTVNLAEIERGFRHKEWVLK